MSEILLFSRCNNIQQYAGYSRFFFAFIIQTDVNNNASALPPQCWPSWTKVGEQGRYSKESKLKISTECIKAQRQDKETGLRFCFRIVVSNPCKTIRFVYHRVSVWPRAHDCLFVGEESFRIRLITRWHCLRGCSSFASRLFVPVSC